MSDAPETRNNNLREAHAWIGAAQARIAELEAALAAKTLAELPAHMGMNDNDQPQEKETP